MSRRSWLRKNYFADRGYGYISPDDGSADVFCHVSSFAPGVDKSYVKAGLPTYARVHFESEPDRYRDRLRAANVSLAAERNLPGQWEGGKNIRRRAGGYA